MARASCWKWIGAPSRSSISPAPIYCIADVCSHDDGPVAEGELNGYEIECPRHGAHFDVRTGKVLSFPAIVDIPAYPVRVEDDVVYVGTAARPELAQGPSRPPAGALTPKSSKSSPWPKQPSSRGPGGRVSQASPTTITATMCSLPRLFPTSSTTRSFASCKPSKPSTPSWPSQTRPRGAWAGRYPRSSSRCATRRRS